MDDLDRLARAAHRAFDANMCEDTDTWKQVARAVLREAREPTEEMIAAANAMGVGFEGVPYQHPSPRESWQAMMDKLIGQADG